MQGFCTMLKMNLKLMLRNKGYLISVIGIPMLSLFWIWFIQYSSTVSTTVSAERQIKEIELNDKILQDQDCLTLGIKVYDASQSKASDYLLQALSNYALYSFYRVDASDLSVEEVKANATTTAEQSNLFTSLYIPADFEENIVQGKTDYLVTLFTTSEDERALMLQSNCKELLKTVALYSSMAKHNKESFYQLLNKLERAKIMKEVKTVSTSDVMELSADQKNQKSSFGYVLAFFSLSFLLSGVFISNIYVSEKNNNVLKRVTLTKASFINYISVKVVLAFITLILEEIVICIGLYILGDSVGLSILQFIYVTSGVGIVLLLLAIAVGTYTNNAVTVAFGGFFAWTISNCLAGLYFPLSESSSLLQAMARLMPQYWSMKYYSMTVTGTGYAALSFLVVTLGFIALMGGIGMLGLKLTSKK